MLYPTAELKAHESYNGKFYTDGRLVLVPTTTAAMLLQKPVDQVHDAITEDDEVYVLDKAGVDYEYVMPSSMLEELAARLNKSVLVKMLSYRGGTTGYLTSMFLS